MGIAAFPANTIRWPNAGPLSLTSGQHWSNVASSLLGLITPCVISIMLLHKLTIFFPSLPHTPFCCQCLIRNVCHFGCSCNSQKEIDFVSVRCNLRKGSLKLMQLHLFSTEDVVFYVSGEGVGLWRYYKAGHLDKHIRWTIGRQCWHLYRSRHRPPVTQHDARAFIHSAFYVYLRSYYIEMLFTACHHV